MAYAIVKDVRDAGVTTTVVADDAQVLDAINLSEQFIERVTRQWFESRTLTVRLDGNDSDTLFFPLPIISVASLKINGSSNALDTSYYEVYAGRALPDDRKNPRIGLVSSTEYHDIYTSPGWSGRLVFKRGHRNQEVTGDFGYTEPDGSTPLAIKRATIKLAVEKLTSPIYAPPGCAAPAPPPSPGSGVVVSERTDGHSITYAVPAAAPQRLGFTGFTRDPEVLDILRVYRAPIGIAAPADWSFS